MKFEEAHKLWLSGKKVRRLNWLNKNYCLGDIKCPECDCEIDYEDAIADDWEIYECT